MFQPERRGPVPDLEHEEFVKCLMNSYKEGYLDKAEFDRRVRRGRPITVITKPQHFGRLIEKKKPKTKKSNCDIDAIIATVKDLSTYVKLVQDEANQFPYSISLHRPGPKRQLKMRRASSSRMRKLLRSGMRKMTRAA